MSEPTRTYMTTIVVDRRERVYDLSAGEFPVVFVKVNGKRKQVNHLVLNAFTCTVAEAAALKAGTLRWQDVPTARQRDIR